MFTVAVNIENLTTVVNGAQWDLTYDESLIFLNNVFVGDAFDSATSTTYCPPWVEPNSSTVRIGCVGVGPDAGSIDGGTVVTLEFTALAVGSSDLTFVSQLGADTAAPPNSVPLIPIDGTVTIGSQTAESDADLLAAANSLNGSDSAAGAHVVDCAGVTKVRKKIHSSNKFHWLFIFMQFMKGC